MVAVAQVVAGLVGLVGAGLLAFDVASPVSHGLAWYGGLSWALLTLFRFVLPDFIRRYGRQRGSILSGLFVLFPLPFVAVQFLAQQFLGIPCAPGDETSAPR